MISSGLLTICLLSTLMVSISTSGVAATDAVPVAVEVLSDSTGTIFSADSTAIYLEADGIYVLYFHQTVRCPDCITIEAYARDVLEEDFSELVKEGKLFWQDIDFELPLNAHFQDRYGLELTSIVLSRRKNGVEVEWIHLDETWELLENGQPLTEYFLFAIEDMLYLEE